MIPEPIDGYTDLARSDTLVSKNGVFEPPAAPCDIIIGMADEVVIEENSSCAEVTGNLEAIDSGSGGHSYRMPLQTPSPDYENGVIWSLKFDEAGEYDLWATLPLTDTPSSEATYEVRYAAGASVNVIINPTEASGEARLGRFEFDTGDDQLVRLGNNYDDAANQGKYVTLDALRVRAAEDADEEDPSNQPDTNNASSDGMNDGQNPNDGPSTDPDASIDEELEGAETSDELVVDTSGGCSAAHGKGPLQFLVILGFAALGLKRSRRTI